MYSNFNHFVATRALFQTQLLVFMDSNLRREGSLLSVDISINKCFN